MSFTKSLSRGVRIVVVACFCTFAAIGCGQKLTQENVDKIKVGMGQADVEALIGKPTGTTSTKIPGGMAAREEWKEGDKVVRIDFFNDKVMMVDKSGL